MTIGIHCCENCVPPKRKVGCHGSCPEYFEAREKYEKDKKMYEESKNPVIYRSQFVGNAKRRKKSKKPAV